MCKKREDKQKLFLVHVLGPSMYIKYLSVSMKEKESEASERKSWGKKVEVISAEEKKKPNTKSQLK